MFESLESRVLLSVTFVNNVLKVNGTPRPDQISVTTLADAGPDGALFLRVSVNGVTQDVTITDRTTARILIDGASRPDFISVSGVPVAAVLRGSDGHDTLVGGAGPSTLMGGGGNDTLAAGSASATLMGGGGNDSLIGGAADDVLLGEGGNDLLRDGGSGETTGGNDFLSGGGGKDTADYSQRSGDLVLSLDDQGNDGYRGTQIGSGGNVLGPEFDNIRPDVEQVIGGTGNDSITGSARADSLVGGPGNDTLVGLAGNDTLDGDGTASRSLTDTPGQSGTSGNDVLNGGAGNDILIGGYGADEIHGGAGRDIAQFFNRQGQNIAVTFDDQPNDGYTAESSLHTPPVAEGDNVFSDVERFQLKIRPATGGPTG